MPGTPYPKEQMHRFVYTKLSERQIADKLGPVALSGPTSASPLSDVSTPAADFLHGTDYTDARSRVEAAIPALLRQVAAARAALEIAEQAKSVGPLAELEEKVLANPDDHQARFDLAAALNAKGKRAEAVEHLLAIVKRDRKWNDDGARKQLVQFFDAWGPTDAATVEGRKRLSSILFS